MFHLHVELKWLSPLRYQAMYSYTARGTAESYSEWGLMSVPRQNYWLNNGLCQLYLSKAGKNKYLVLLLKKKKKALAASVGNCDQRKWKGVSEVATLLEDAHQSENRGPSSAPLGKVFSPRSCQSWVESGTAQLSALSCSVGTNAELQQCWTFAEIGTSLLLESFPRISVMVSKE